jgi:hypothetical protein
MSDMKKDDVKAVLGRVLTWPAEAQREAVSTLRAIEEEWESGDAIPGELETIDEADREALERSADDVRNGRFATDDKVRQVFHRYRSA